MGNHSTSQVYRQAGAIPYRKANGAIQVLIISTSSGKNWTIPKGLIDPGFSAMETVMNEALEEAGIQGRVLTPSIGEYRFAKWGGWCKVEVFVMAVTRELEHWPEDQFRQRVWVNVKQAARQVKHTALGNLILSIDGYLDHRQPTMDRCHLQRPFQTFVQPHSRNVHTKYHLFLFLFRRTFFCLFLFILTLFGFLLFLFIFLLRL